MPATPTGSKLGSPPGESKQARAARRSASDLGSLSETRRGDGFGKDVTAQIYRRDRRPGRETVAGPVIYRIPSIQSASTSVLFHATLLGRRQARHVGPRARWGFIPHCYDRTTYRGRGGSYENGGHLGERDVRATGVRSLDSLCVRDCYCVGYA